MIHRTGSSVGAELSSLGRLYFAAAVLVMLTLGGGLSLWLLRDATWHRSLTDMPLDLVNVHGQAIIFGTLLFTMTGASYQRLAEPRERSRQPSPRIGLAVFWVLLIGLVIRSIGMTGMDGMPLAGILTLFGGGIQVAAVGLLLSQLVPCLVHRTPLRQSAGLWSLGLASMTIMSVFSVWLTWGLMAAPDMPRVLWLISTYQMPLRNVQVHGMALALLLALTGGMSWRADRPTGFRRRVTLGCLTIGLLMEVTLFIAFRWTGQLMFAASLLPAWILILVGVIVSSKRDKRRRPANSFHGEYRFTRAAFQWLILSLLMLMAMPLYQALTGIAFSHAYYGAIQHAALVGFTTQAAMGWIQTATQHDKPSKSHHLFVRWGPFVLLNLGCAMRLYIQVLTDFHPAAFGLLPVTGLIEWLAMVWWAVPVLRKLIHTPQLTGRVPDAGGQVVLPKVPRQSARSGLTKLGHSLR